MDLIKKQELENQKSELINDLMATVTITEELWSYHPENPKKVDIVVEYEKLQQIKADVEKELEEIEEELTTFNAKYSLMNDQEVIENTSESLKNGDAIGWFQGRMEFGPRALGGRSILGDP